MKQKQNIIIHPKTDIQTEVYNEEEQEETKTNSQTD